MTDAIVIGGGVIGLSIARELSCAGKETIVLEKNERAGDVTSSRNSGVIHAGIYYPENFLKTKLCTEGNKLIYEYADQKNINHKKFGKFIIATNKKELLNLEVSAAPCTRPLTSVFIRLYGITRSRVQARKFATGHVQY